MELQRETFEVEEMRIWMVDESEGMIKEKEEEEEEKKEKENEGMWEVLLFINSTTAQAGNEIILLVSHDSEWQERIVNTVSYLTRIRVNTEGTRGEKAGRSRDARGLVACRVARVGKGVD